jgi:predicted RNA-binding Zn-ribbon protein involved in translation (DUF1610 family)
MIDIYCSGCKRPLAIKKVGKAKTYLACPNCEDVAIEICAVAKKMEPPKALKGYNAEIKNCSKCGGLLGRLTNIQRNTILMKCHQCGFQPKIKIPKMDGPPILAGYDSAMREDIVKQLGGKCVMCGEDRHVRLLQIDHINAIDGKVEKNAFGSGSKEYYEYIRLTLPSGKYQALCSNCNQWKSLQGQEYDSSVTPEKLLGLVEAARVHYELLTAG